MKALRLFSCCLLMAISGMVHAQDDPVVVLNQINAAVSGVSAKYLAYQSAMAHGSKARKCEKKRQELMDQIDKARYAIAETPYYKGDKSLHQSTTAYLKMTTDLFNENYSKLVNLEDIAEQSYDDMEAYILLKKQLAEKMDSMSEANHQKVVEYCAKNNIKLVEKDESVNSQKMKKVGQVMDYYNEIYLVFFKCSVQDDHLVSAMNEKNITAMEQAKSAMDKYADEGLEKLKSVKSFDNDPTMTNACRNAIQFFKKEAAKSAALIDFMMKQESFDKVKKNFERNSNAQNDKAEIDKYNAAVKDLNNALNTFNQANQDLNKGRTDTYNNWNGATTAFMDTHVPYSK